MSTRLLGLLALSLLLSAPARAARRIVKFHPSVDKADRVRLAETASRGRVVRELSFIDAVVVETPDAQVRSAEARLRSLSQVARVDDSPRVKWIEVADARGLDFRVPALNSIIKPFVPTQEAPPADPPAPAGQETPWGITRVQAPQAWANTRGAGVKLVVIDTGIDRTHPDLAARLKGGWNAITQTEDYNDDNGHGTHCAGTIGAVDDEAGVVGVAPEVDLYGVKVLDAGGSGTFDDVIAGMQWAVENRMQIASMSLGASRGNPALEDAVKAMEAAGVTLIAAAGNSGGAVGFPGGYEGAIGIAASDARDNLARFSSRGPEVDLIAPGVGVKSTYMGGTYSSLSGTSMATPHVSGLAALYVARNPSAGPAAVRAALVAASVRLPNVIPEGQGAGLPLAPALAQ